MFNYREFKKEMNDRGHDVWKKGRYLTICPNNNYHGYGEGFAFGTDVIEGYEEYLTFVSMSHYNTWIYTIRFKIKEE